MQKMVKTRRSSSTDSALHGSRGSVMRQVNINTGGQICQCAAYVNVHTVRQERQKK